MVDPLQAIASAGLFGVLIGERYGGLGASTAEYAEALAEFGATDSGITLSWEVHVLATEVYQRYGDDAQREHWLPPTGRRPGVARGGRRWRILQI